jgi:hypothetical protein
VSKDKLYTVFFLSCISPVHIYKPNYKSCISCQFLFSPPRFFFTPLAYKSLFFWASSISAKLNHLRLFSGIWEKDWFGINPKNPSPNFIYECHLKKNPPYIPFWVDLDRFRMWNLLYLIMTWKFLPIFLFGFPVSFNDFCNFFLGLMMKLVMKIMNSDELTFFWKKNLIEKTNMINSNIFKRLKQKKHFFIESI